MNYSHIGPNVLKHDNAGRIMCFLKKGDDFDMAKADINTKSETEKTTDENQLQKKQEDNAVSVLNDYVEGAKLFRRFIRRPEKYKNQKVFLRVKMNGLFYGWKLKEELTSAFGITPGECLFMNDLYVLGYENPDVEKDTWTIDGMAVGEAADWIEDADITRGTVFEGIFSMRYEPVLRITSGDSMQKTMIAMLILEKGHDVIVLNDRQEDDNDTKAMRDFFAKLLKE